MAGSFLEARSEVYHETRSVSLELIEMLSARALERSSCELHVDHPQGGVGVIGVVQGRVTHARTSRSAGVPAFLEIARWSGAQITERARVSDETTILMELDDLLGELNRHGRHDARTGIYQSLSDEMTNVSPYQHSTQEEALPMTGAHYLSEVFEEDEEVCGANDDHGFFQAALRASRTKITALLPPDSVLCTLLVELCSLKGFVAGAVIDASRGEAVAVERTSVDFDVSAAAEANAVLMRAGAFGSMGAVEDVVVTLGDQYHLMRPIASSSGLFFYLAMHRDQANLALARLALEELSARAAA